MNRRRRDKTTPRTKRLVTPTVDPRSSRRNPVTLRRPRSRPPPRPGRRVGVPRSTSRTFRRQPPKHPPVRVRVRVRVHVRVRPRAPPEPRGFGTGETTRTRAGATSRSSAPKSSRYRLHALQNQPPGARVEPRVGFVERARREVQVGVERRRSEARARGHEAAPQFKAKCTRGSTGAGGVNARTSRARSSDVSSANWLRNAYGARRLRRMSPFSRSLKLSLTPASSVRTASKYAPRARLDAAAPTVAGAIRAERL